jgi:hypothetical protein
MKLQNSHSKLPHVSLWHGRSSSGQRSLTAHSQWGALTGPLKFSSTAQSAEVECKTSQELLRLPFPYPGITGAAMAEVIANSHRPPPAGPRQSRDPRNCETVTSAKRRMKHLRTLQRSTLDRCTEVSRPKSVENRWHRPPPVPASPPDHRKPLPTCYNSSLSPSVRTPSQHGQPPQPSQALTVLSADLTSAVAARWV